MGGGVIAAVQVALTLIGGDQEYFGISGLHADVDDARQIVHEQHLLPVLSPVRGLEQAALGVGSP